MIAWLHRALMRITRKGKAILSVFAIYISVTGLVTFSLFILEESIQTAMFGTWPAQDAKDWEVVRFGLDRIKNANSALKTINYSLGWIQPLAFVSYKCYGESADAYIAGLEAKLFANAPHLFSGKTVTFMFTPQTVTESSEGGFMHVNHSVVFVSSQRYPAAKPRRVTGMVSAQGDQVIIRETPQ